MTTKPAKTAVEIHPPIAQRFSTVAFRPEPISALEIHQLMEASRWAPSSYNDQPWSFLLAPRDRAEEFQKLLGCLAESNQTWAKNAGLLVLVVAQQTLKLNGNPNRFGMHDTGMASYALMLQAESMGLKAHAMGGYNVAQAKALYAIPETHELAAVIAIGYPGDPQALSPELQKREASERSRQPLEKSVFIGKFGQPFPLG